MTLNKKAQVSLFMILGLIVLIVIGFFTVQQLNQQPEVRRTVAEIPQEAQPVRDFVQSCLADTLEQGILLLGERGGYLDTSNFAENELQPTEADGVNAFSKLIPYWWYLQSSNDCTGQCEFSSKKPNLYSKSGSPSIEGQLDTFITEHISDCLQNFASFTQQGFSITPLRELEAQTFVGEETVGTYISYPLEIERADATYNIEDYVVELPVQFKDIFLLATNLTNHAADNETKFLEKFTINLISAYSGTEEHNLPSMADSEFETHGTVWVEHEVRENIQDILHVYTQALQVEDTLNYEPVLIEDELTAQLYKNMVLPNAQISAPHSNVDITFDYLNWPLYLDLNCEGGLCKPEQIVSQTLFIPLGLQRYNFVYDISYPVVVSITDPAAFNGKGFTFTFALEVNVRNNEPMQSSFYPITQLVVDERTMMCQPNQRNTGNITVIVRDAKTKNTIEDTVISAHSGDEGCTIGTTQAEAETTSLTSKFPVMCGYMHFIHPEYLGVIKELCLTRDQERTLEVELEKFRTINITANLKKFVKTGDDWTFLDRAFPLSTTDQALITFERIGKPQDDSFSTTVVLDDDQLQQETLFVPGTYRVTASVMSFETITIPDRQQRSCSLLGLSCQTITIPGFTFDGYFPYGVVAWDTPETYLVIDDVREFDTMTMNVLVYDLINVPERQRVIEDMQKFDELTQDSRRLINELQPVVVHHE